jgi:hypothetical protein
MRTTVVLAMALLPLAAHALCTSDRVPQPQAVLERFTSADCDDCWRDPRTPAAAANVLAVDWVVPGSKGDDAPLSAVASGDALQRLEALGRAAPAASDAVTSLRRGPALPLRIALGRVVNDYVGTSIAIPKAGAAPLDAWLILVEELPAGAEGSPVARNLVRNVFRTPAAGQLREARAMQVHEGARPERLRLVALVQDASGRMRAISRTECRE